MTKLTRLANSVFGRISSLPWLGDLPDRSFKASIYVLTLVAVAAVYIVLNITSPFWLDETFTGAVSCQSSFAALMPLITHDVHPVLYHVLIHLMFAVTGCHLWLVRCLSLVSALGGAWLLLRAIARRGGDMLMALALTAGNPIFWAYAFEARAYGLLFLAGTGVVVYGFSDRASDNIKGVAFALMGGLLHYYASFLFAALFVIVVVGRRPGMRLKWFWLAFFAAGIMLSAYYWLQLGHLLATGSALRWIPPPSILDLVMFPLHIFGTLSSEVVMVIIASLIGAVLSAAPGHGSREGKILLGLFCGLVLLLFAVSFVRPTFVYRYVHFLVPAMIMGSALLARDARAALAASSPVRGVSFANVTFMLLVAFMLMNLIGVLTLPATNRNMGWQKAMARMDCSSVHPCGFVLDDPVLPSMTPEQYKALANFLAREPGSFIPLQPRDMSDWIRQRPGEQILYIRSFMPLVDIQHLRALPLECDDKYRIAGVGAIPCRSLALAQPSEPTPK